jgi:hypothetical protein
MKIYTGHGTPLWLSLRENNGLITMQGTSRLLLDAEELQQYLDAIYRMTGVKAATGPVTTTPAKAQLQRYRMA